MRWRWLTIALFTGLSACGQTGDLFIPDASPAAEPVATPDTPTENEKDDEETPAG